MVSDWNNLMQHISEFGVCKLDPDGIIILASPAMEHLTGYKPEELTDTPYWELYPDPSLSKVRLEYELNMARKNGWFTWDAIKRKKDGSLFWSRNSFRAICNEKGETTGFLSVISDITERKNTENELRRSEERFRIMVEAVRDYAIFMLDKTGHIITWNEGGKRIKGYSAHEIIGKHFSIFYTREDLDIKKPENELRIALATGKYEEEGWRVKKDGSVFWANVLITALYNENNEHIGFSKVTRDLSERRETEERLRQSEQRTRLLIEQVKEYGIFMLDEKGRIASWNEGAKRINGYEESEVLGKYFSIFYPEEDKLNNKPLLELKVARETGKFEEEGWRVRKDGSVFWANVVITAIRDNKNRLIGYSKVTRDLSEKREAEKILRESYEQTRNLAVQLTRANKELAYANQELEQFTSIVSHDLQEPIRTIKSFLQLVDRKLEEDKTVLKDYIHRAMSAATRMRELIQNLLQYSQLAKEEIVLEDVNVDEMISDVLQNLRGAIKDSGAKISFDIKVHYLKGYGFQLSQLLQNIISNSLKFTRDVRPEIIVSNSELENGVLFSVADNGIGIAASDKDKIFEIFKRLDSKNQYPGTGIGLSISKKIVERHNGSIWLESEPGKGTTFYFTINTKYSKPKSAFLETNENEKS